MALVARAHTWAQRRCKESIVMTTDCNVRSEENVTQMMTHKSQAAVHSRGLETVFSIQRQHTNDV